MINLDQVRTLEWKVKQAVQLIVHLRRENDTLRGRLSDAEVRLQELDSLMESFKATQNELESGIRNALEDLDNLEEGSAPAPAGSVDALSYPPASEHQEPSAEAAPEPVSAAEESDSAAAPSFEEEYAALAAAEAEALAGESFDSTIEEVEAVARPESVELEDLPPTSEHEDESLVLEPAGEAEPEAEPEVEPVVPEEKQPEQPGLGIF